MGKHWKVLSPEEKQRIISLRAQGKTVLLISYLTKRSKASVNRVLKEFKDETTYESFF